MPEESLRNKSSSKSLVPQAANYLAGMKPWQTYVFAVGVTFGTLALRFALNKQVGGESTLVIFTLPIMLSAYVGGLRAGLLATALSYLLATYLLRPPIYSFSVALSAEHWNQFFVVLAGVVISALNEALHRARRRADAATRLRQLADEALLKAAPLQVAIFKSAVFSVIATDKAGVIQLFNVGAERLLGYAAGDVVNKVTPADLSDPTEVIARAQTLSREFAAPIAPGFEALVYKASRGIEDIYELTKVRKDGSRFPAIVSVTALRDAQNEIIGYLLIGTDNTARKQAEERSSAAMKGVRDLQAALDEHAIVEITNPLGKITYINDKFCTISKYARDELLGQDHRIINSGYHPKEFIRNLWSTITSGQVWKGELRNRAKDGSIYWVDTTIVPFLNAEGKPEQYIAIRADITERKRMEARFRRLMDSNAQGVMCWKATGEISVANDAFLSIVGYTRDDLLAGRLNWRDLTPLEFREGDRQALEEIGRKGFCTALEKEYVRKDGTLISVLIGAAVFEDDLAEGVCFVIDRTESQLAKVEAVRLAAIVESTSDAVIGTDLNGIVTSWNAAADRIFGYSAQEMVGRPIAVIIPPDHSEDERKILDQIKTGQRVEHFETVRLHKNGSRIDISLTVAPTRDFRGRVSGASKVARDISERKRIAEKLLAFNTELEQRVVERTAQLVAANDELGAFSYSVSHDLRAPLRSIDGFSQALLEDYSDRLDAEGQDHLRRVRAASQRMGQLIDDLLTLSRVTRADLAREPVDLSKMAREIAQELRSTAPDRDVEFVTADGLLAETDPRLIRIVLTNLLNNALKFTSKQSHARVEFGTTGSNGHTEYFVRDNGAGFDPEYVSKLFGAFQRLHSAQEFPGTGIGLATVQRIIHRQGGRVWAEGKINQGATFHFTL